MTACFIVMIHDCLFHFQSQYVMIHDCLFHFKSQYVMIHDCLFHFQSQYVMIHDCLSKMLEEKKRVTEPDESLYVNEAYGKCQITKEFIRQGIN